MGREFFGFDNKRVLVVGGATGMGAAAAQLAGELGGEVHVLDVADVAYPCDEALRVDLSEKASVDEALGKLEGPFHALFSCAGIFDGPSVMRVNFIAQRHIVDSMVADGRLGSGSAVAMISSIGGAGWQAQLDVAKEFLANATWESMDRWVEGHEGTNNYTFSKVAMNTYVAAQAFEFAKRRMRINAVMPGGTDTPLAHKHPDTWLPFQGDYRAATGLPHLTPEQMGNVVAFLCMDAASGVNGTTVVVDDGYIASHVAGTFESETVRMLLGGG
ncbi:MAG TPA: SDR family oxidoreductase [Acidimicrobiales bacterium]|nr:SDR family oxidoreductase [Acidimicrobiales bacterium]